MNAAYGALAANVVLLLTGQLLWKVGMLRAGGFGWQRLVTSPFVWGGLVIYALATLLWLYVLSRLPLSVAYPVQALAYVLSLAAARLLLGEAVPALSWVGGLLILLGVGLIAWRPGT